MTVGDGPAGDGRAGDGPDASVWFAGATGWEALAPARRRAELSMGALYLRYVALGGSVPSMRLAEHFDAGTEMSAGEHDLAVLALNERFLEMDAVERLPYLRDAAPRWGDGEPGTAGRP